MSGKIPKVNPEEIVVTPGGGILYRGRDIRSELNLPKPRSKLLNTNLACINASSCSGINLQCDNLEEMPMAVNFGFCANS
jgi:hypothetical protein